MLNLKTSNLRNVKLVNNQYITATIDIETESFFGLIKGKEAKEVFAEYLLYKKGIASFKLMDTGDYIGTSNAEILFATYTGEIEIVNTIGAKLND